MAPPLFTGLKFGFVSNGSANNQEPAPTDPYFANRKLLLHMDGSNNSTTFTDSSNSALSVTATNAVISTAQSKFGGACGYFNGSAYITTPASVFLAAGSGNFTAEFWIRPTAFNNPSVLYDSRFGGGTQKGFAIGTTSSGQVFFYSGTTTYITTTTTVTLNQWTHIAAVRSGTTVYIFINGVQSGSNTCSLSFTDGFFTFGKTNEAAANYFVGYADDLRFSDRAEYTSNFTPLTGPFPNS